MAFGSTSILGLLVDLFGRAGFARLRPTGRTTRLRGFRIPRRNGLRISSLSTRTLLLLSSSDI